MRASVIIPAYNAARFLPECLESVFRQTLAPEEIIVVNDGSRDGTEEVLRSYGNRLRWWTQANAGESASRNRAVKEARGEWIALLDADDSWFPQKLELQAEATRNNPSAQWSYGAFIERREPSGEVRRVTVPHPTLVRRKLGLRNVLHLSTVMIRRDVYLALGGFDEKIQFGEDWEFWLRLASRYKSARVSEPLGIYRRHAGNQSGNYEKTLQSNRELTERVLLRGMHPMLASVRRRTLMGRFYADAAVMARQNGDERSAKYMRESFKQWPLPMAVPDKRFKIGAHMLLFGSMKRNPVAAGE